MKAERVVWFSGLLLLACRSSAVAPSPEVAPSASAAAEPANAPVATAPLLDLGRPEQQFIVHAASGAVELRSTATGAARVLAPHADVALHDPQLDLMWFRAGDRLSVVDLRASEPVPTLIALGLPNENRLSIDRGDALTYTDDGCAEAPTIALMWSATPSIEAVLTKAPELRIENTAWLSAELMRAKNAVGARRGFGKERVRLPVKLLDCDEAKVCGTTVALGGRREKLVRVQENEGDCVQRACLLHDPETGLYADPAVPEQWDKPERVQKGSCGTYLFDRAQTSYLVANQLCTPEGCRKLDGAGIGWLVPGDRVGLPGFAGED